MTGLLLQLLWKVDSVDQACVVAGGVTYRLTEVLTLSTVLTGVMYPSEGQISKQQGRLVTKFGPLKNWKLTAKADSYQVH